MTALTPKAFRFKLNPGDWQHASPCAGYRLQEGLCAETAVFSSTIAKVRASLSRGLQQNRNQSGREGKIKSQQ